LSADLFRRSEPTKVDREGGSAEQRGSREGVSAERDRACPAEARSAKAGTFGVNSCLLTQPDETASELHAQNTCGFRDLHRRSGACAFGLDLDDVSRACYDEPPDAGG
jgi:hypothetical protein